jgi:ADP-heptose:LPS heptosyltransferase
MAVPPQPRKVLILKPSSLGDVLTALPVLRGLRRTFPRAHIAWLVVPSCAGMLAGQKGLDEVILFDRKRYGRMLASPAALAGFVGFCRQLRRQGFDWVIDLQGLFRSGFLSAISGAKVRAGFADARELADLFYTHKIATAGPHVVDQNIQLARALGVDARAEDFALDLAPEGMAAAASLLAQSGLGERRFIVIAPGTRWPTKNYPARRWRSVVQLLTPKFPIVLVGGDAERELCKEIACGPNRVQPNSNDGLHTLWPGAAAGTDATFASPINLAGQTDLPTLAAVIARAAAVICGDSAANFIAPAVGTPHLAIIGPTNPVRTGPYRSGKALVADIPCQGCLLRRCPHITCMQFIEPADVVREVLALVPEP